MSAQNEIAAIRAEINAIHNTVGAVREVISIRQEVEAIRREKDAIVQQARAAPAAPAPVVAAAPVEQPKAAPVVEQPKPVAQPAPVVEQPKPAPAPAPVVEQPKPAAQPAPVVEQPKPVAQPAPVAQAPVVKEAPKPAAQPAPAAAAPVAQPAPAPAAVSGGAVPSLASQKWAGRLLSHECDQFYNLVRNDRTSEDWVALHYLDNNRVGVAGIGSGGVSDLKKFFAVDNTGFGYLRVVSGDAESRRTKFVLVAWSGERANIMRKAKMSVHRGQVKEVFNQFAIEIQASDLDDLTDDKVLAQVKRAGGANYNGQNN